MLPLIIFTLIFVLLAIAGPWLGADSRDGQDWRITRRPDPSPSPETPARP
ncbi:hypothetical protein ACRYCC_19195 [Actinomadura scrupuli]